jgi:multiple sugar transport system ATP-binding protein
MTLGQRVCVMLDGKLQQVDSPQTLFNSPVNLFVAGFMGSPAMNFVDAALVRDDGPAVTFADYRLPVPEALFASRPGLDGYIGRQVILGIRPSDFEDGSLADSNWPRIQARADVTEALGTEIHVLFRIDAPPVRHSALGQATAAGADVDPDDAALPLGGGKSLWTARVAARSTIGAGQPVELAVQTSNLQFFDADTGLSIGHPQAREYVSFEDKITSD